MQFVDKTKHQHRIAMTNKRVNKWFFLLLLMASCYNNHTDKYKAVGYNFAIEVLSRNESTIEARMIWNELKEDEVDCQVLIMDRRILSQYEPCPLCPNKCDE